MKSLPQKYVSEDSAFCCVVSHGLARDPVPELPSRKWVRCRGLARCDLLALETRLKKTDRFAKKPKKSARGGGYRRGRAV